MNMSHRFGAALALAALALFPVIAFGQLSGPGSAPPGGVTIFYGGGGNTGTAWATYANAAGTGGLYYTNFNWVQNGTIYFVPAGFGGPIPVSYDSSPAPWGGAVVYDAVAGYKTICTGVPATCSNPSLEVRVVITTTNSAVAIPGQWVTGASIGIAVPAAIKVNDSLGFRLFYDFGERLAGSGTSFSNGYTYGDGALGTISPNYNSSFQEAGSFYWAPPVPPTIAKSFPTATIPLNSSTTVTYTIGDTNLNSPLQNLSFADNLAAGLVVSSTPNVTNSCGGVVSASGGSVSLSGGLVSQHSTCTVTVSLTGTTIGPKSSTVGVASSNGGAGNTSTASIDVLGPPAITKTFNPPHVPIGTMSTLSLAITNPNDVTIDANFADALPAGLTFATSPNVTNTCGGTATPSSGTLNFSSSAIPPGPCTVTVDVTNSVDGVYANSVLIHSTAGGDGNTSSANLTVANPPTITKAFGAATIPYGQTTSLTFPIQNTNTSLAATGLSFTDSLPSGLVVATPSALTNSGCGGTATATAGSSSVSLAGGTLAAGAQCSIFVNVTATAFGVQNNSVTASSNEAGSGNTSNASLTVTCAYSLSSSGTSAPAAGMSGSFNVTTTSTCAWTAGSDSTSWLTTSSTGTGNGTVSYTVGGNTLTTTRIGHITVGDQTFTVTQAGVLPANLVATAASPTSVGLTWTSDPVDHFEIWRNSGSGYVSIGTSPTAGYTDNTVTANNAYIYEVRAVDSGANASNFSNKDIATTFVFTDDPLVVSTTFVKGVHVMELRQAVNSLRVLAGLTATTFTDATLTDVNIKAIHITEIRSALDSARSTLGVPSLTYTNTLTPGTSIVSAVDVQEVRDGVK